MSLSAGVTIKTVRVTPFCQNCRIIGDQASGCALVVDPGGEARRIFDEGGLSGIRVESIVFTHGHIDHVSGARDLLSLIEGATGERPRVFAHVADKVLLASVPRQAVMFGLSPAEYPAVNLDISSVSHGDLIAWGGTPARVIHTPGHSPGHICLFFEGRERDVAGCGGCGALLISGDTLFRSGIGRTDLPGGDGREIAESIRRELFSLPDETRVLPGHGPETSIGWEKEFNPFVGSAAADFELC